MGGKAADSTPLKELGFGAASEKNKNEKKKTPGFF
jgi:hypothetical protein